MSFFGPTKPIPTCLITVHPPKTNTLSDNFDGLSTAVDGATESLESAVKDITDITMRLGGAIDAAETLSSEVETHQGQLLVRLKAGVKE